MTGYIICAAIMIAGAISLAVSAVVDSRDQVGAIVGPEFPSHLEIAIAGVVIAAFGIAGWIAAGVAAGMH